MTRHLRIGCGYERAADVENESPCTVERERPRHLKRRRKAMDARRQRGIGEHRHRRIVEVDVWSDEGIVRSDGIAMRRCGDRVSRVNRSRDRARGRKTRDRGTRD